MAILSYFGSLKFPSRSAKKGFRTVVNGKSPNTPPASRAQRLHPPRVPAEPRPVFVHVWATSVQLVVPASRSGPPFLQVGLPGTIVSLTYLPELATASSFGTCGPLSNFSRFGGLQEVTDITILEDQRPEASSEDPSVRDSTNANPRTRPLFAIDRNMPLRAT